jgi:hypothetical protein
VGVRLGVVLSQLVAWRIRRRLGEQDRVSRIALLARQEVESLDQTRELFDGGRNTLSVAEEWRALEERLRQVLLSRRIETRAGAPEVVIHTATRNGILKEPTLGVVSELRRHWTVAASTEPLCREAAVESLSAVRHVLSVIPVKEPAQVPGSGSGVVFEKALIHA